MCEERMSWLRRFDALFVVFFVQVQCNVIATSPLDGITNFNVGDVIKDLKFNPSFVNDVKKSLSKGQLKFKNILSWKIEPDANRDLTQLIASAGYPVQKFVVQTEDGYLLDLHRIPYGRKEGSNLNGKRPVVYLQHGFLASACDWVMNFPNGSLGFILADNGYDVWMGNSRGNTFSKRHISLQPDQDQFWNFSFDEMAKYDTPAFVDFILNKTGQPNLHYIGHSQGTIMGFALLSSQPEYQKKIRSFTGLAPIISLNYMKSPIKYLALLSDQEGYVLLGRRELLPHNWLIRYLVDAFCDKSLTEWICSNIVFLWTGYDTSNLNKSRLVVYLNHSPAGASVKDMIHFGQMYRSKKFAMYDYGSPTSNMMHYGQATPPMYNASKINVPTVLFTATNDWLADPKDVQILESTLPNIKAKYNINEWNHLDFVWGINAAEMCYSKILQWLPKL